MRGLSHHKSRLMFTYAEHFARAVEEIDRPGDTKYKKSITVSWNPFEGENFWSSSFPQKPSCGSQQFVQFHSFSQWWTPLKHVPSNPCSQIKHIWPKSNRKSANDEDTELLHTNVWTRPCASARSSSSRSRPATTALAPTTFSFRLFLLIISTKDSPQGRWQSRNSEAIARDHRPWQCEQVSWVRLSFSR